MSPSVPACRRRTRSGFGEQARFPHANVSVTGTSTAFECVGDEVSRCTFRFCPKCGATVYYEPEGLEECPVIQVGTFADLDFPPSTVSVPEERMRPWVAPPSGTELIP